MNNGHTLMAGDAWAAENLPVALMNLASSLLAVSLYLGMFSLSLDQAEAQALEVMAINHKNNA